MVEALIVEDDAECRDALVDWLRDQGFTSRAVPTLAAAREALAERPPALVIVDHELPDGSGLELLEDLKASSDTDVVLTSASATVDAAVEALRLGARDFLPKPLEMQRLEALARHLARTSELRKEVASLRTALKDLGRFGDLVGESAPMREVYGLLERVAPTDETVLITGATGTGKELTASTIHRLSRRASGPLVVLNCGAVAPNLIESELFGHEKGAFTGADRRRQGVFERADGGTLFLDEVTEMSVDLQVKLLRVLETGVVARVGGSGEIPVDARILAATNRDPEAAVEEGVLREDLFYRLNVVPVALPPLAERGEDVLLLARTFLRRLNDEHGALKSFTPAALERLSAYDWPGNVRELLNVVTRAFILSPRDILASAVEVGEGSGSTASDGEAFVTLEPGMTIAEAERKLIEATLEHMGGRKKAAAAVLGISVKTLYARLKVYAAADGGPGS